MNMWKAKTTTKNFFRGLKPSKGDSKSPPSVSQPPSSLMASEPVGTGSTAAQEFAHSIPERQSAGQTCIGTPVDRNEHSETATNIVVPRESQRSDLSRPSTLTVVPSTLIPAVETPTSSVQNGRECMAMTSRLSKLLSELDVSVAEFRKNYEFFAKKNSDFFLI